MRNWEIKADRDRQGLYPSCRQPDSKQEACSESEGKAEVPCLSKVGVGGWRVEIGLVQRALGQQESKINGEHNVGIFGNWKFTLVGSHWWM